MCPVRSGRAFSERMCGMKKKKYYTWFCKKCVHLVIQSPKNDRCPKCGEKMLDNIEYRRYFGIPD